MLLLIQISITCSFTLISTKRSTYQNSKVYETRNPRSVLSSRLSSSVTAAEDENKIIDDAIVLAKSNPVHGRSHKDTRALDVRILSLALPALLNFAIVPLVGAVDTYWVGRMKNALALAGQGAANQVFSSAFWIISFLPSVVVPMVAKAAGSGDPEAVQARVGEAVFLGTIMGIIGMALLTGLPEYALSLVLPIRIVDGIKIIPPAREFAAPYLAVRAITFLPSLLSTVGFAAFRGTMDMQTPVKISLLSNIINVILDPFLIFNAGMGVAGAAAATCVSEVIAFILYAQQLIKKKMIKVEKMLKPPSIEALKPLLLGGLGVQMRAVALNIAFLAVTRTTQALDSSGTAAAAHAITIQLWQLGGIFLLALSTVAAIIVPSEAAKALKENRSDGLSSAKFAADRLLTWGAVLGVALAGVQLLCLPLLGVFSPLPEVQQAARLPSVIGAALQVINGVVFIGEGIQQGNQYFGHLAACTAVATVGMLLSLKTFGSSLAGVWGSFAVFNLVRLAGVLNHHFRVGPLAPHKVRANEAATAAAAAAASSGSTASAAYR